MYLISLLKKNTIQDVPSTSERKTTQIAVDAEENKKQKDLWRQSSISQNIPHKGCPYKSQQHTLSACAQVSAKLLSGPKMNLWNDQERINIMLYL